MEKVSIIIRTKNEEQWIDHCLQSIFKQNYKNFEVIIVDNLSDDHTIKIVKRYPIDKILYIKNFKPGLAINIGVENSSGDFVVCLSAHCVPKNSKWLSKLTESLTSEKNVAAVYGRQLPVSFTSDVDKRDLFNIFGLDRRVQIKDYFFHNANSIFKKEVWETKSFDESVSNIEDRVWAKTIINLGYKIVYEPEAAVYHYHGLHQGNTPQRAKGVVSIIDKVDENILKQIPETMKPGKIKVSCFIPVNEPISKDKIKLKLLNELIRELQKTKYINDIHILCYEKNIVPDSFYWIDRKKINDINKLDLNELLKTLLLEVEKKNFFPHAILYINYQYQFRPSHFFDKLISDAQYKGYDTVFPGYIDYGNYWFLNENDEFVQTDKSLKLRDEKQPIYKALYGLGCLTSSSMIRKGKMVGGKVGILPIEQFKYTLRHKDVLDLNVKNL